MKTGHMMDMAGMGQQVLWAHFLVIVLGAWLLTSPLPLALFDPAGAGAVHDVTQERGLWEPALRDMLTGWSDVACGLLLMLFGSLALSPRFAWAQWGTTVVGLWLLFAPLFFWTPSAAATINDTVVGALAIVFSVLVPMMPGISHEGMMDESTVPPGWSYSPSSWLQRLPIIALSFFGFLIARYLTAYQLGQVGSVWEPFFSGGNGRNGTEFIITSDVFRAWPIPDAGLGAAAYTIEALMGAMGTATRWPTMPWMVTFFFILVVPLGGVSIFFIIIQPIVIGTYSTLCLIAALAMLIMIPLTLDEVVAMGQYIVRSTREARPFWRTFFQGGPEPNGGADKKDPGFSAAFAAQSAAAVRGCDGFLDIVSELHCRCLAHAVAVGFRHRRSHRKQRSPRRRHDHHDSSLRHGRSGTAAPVPQPAVWTMADRSVMATRRRNRGLILERCCCRAPRDRLRPAARTESEEHYGSWDRYVV